jgi:pyruvate/2-oxoglutarate dehydrogenase complex dihydrolipoamide acyltransferase (E2) component
MITLWIILLVGVLWILLNLKTSRPDAKLVERVHPYRQMMFYVMPTRTESVFMANLDIPAEKLEAYLDQAGPQLQANVSHVAVGALIRTLTDTPNMNRFVTGGRLYQRNAIKVSFSMKRKKLDAAAKVSVVHLEAEPGENFEELCLRINAQVNKERSGEKTYADKEFDLFTKVPHGLMKIAPSFLRWLDAHNLLPASFINNDALYCSAFLANLGSLKMPSGHHHLFEGGNCPAFITIGEIEDKAAVVDGKLIVQRQIPVRITYDERIDDGLTARAALRRLEEILSDPQSHLGCVSDDLSDRFPLSS